MTIKELKIKYPKIVDIYDIKNFNDDDIVYFTGKKIKVLKRLK